MTSRSRRLTNPLRIQQLEAREVPAGNIIASLSNGILTLTGDDYDNQIVILKTPNGVQLSANDDTTFNGQTTFTQDGLFTSVKANLKGGNDRLEIDDSTPFVITGSFNANMGDGNNILQLESSGEVSFGSLIYTGGDGDDEVSWMGTVGSKATGNVTLTYGDGETSTKFTNTTVNGLGGINISAREGDDEITFENVSTLYDIKASMGAKALDFEYNTGQFRALNISAAGNMPGYASGGVIVDLTDISSTRGGVTVTSKTAIQFSTDTTDYKSLSLTSGANGYNEIDFIGTSRIRGAATLRGFSNEINIQEGANLTIDGAFNSIASSITSAYLADSRLTAKSINFTGTMLADFLQVDLNDAVDTSLTVNGNFVLNGRTASYVQRSGTADIAGAMNLWGKSFALLSLEEEAIISRVGAASTIQATSGEADFIVTDNSGFQFNNNLTISGTELTSVFLTPSLTSVIQGNLSVTGGTGDDIFSSTSTVQFDKNLSLNLKGGSNSIYLGDSNGITAIGGNVTITTGSGNDEIVLDQIDVTGLTSVVGGAGSDRFFLSGASTLRKLFTLNLGLGDDSISLGTETGSTAGVNFLGKVTITGGAGNDELYLGLSEGSGGDAFSKVSFWNLSSNISGGTNVNYYSASDSQFEGSVNLLNWI